MNRWVILKVFTLFSTRCSFELYHKTNCSGLKHESYYAMTLQNVSGLFSGLRLSSVGCLSHEFELENGSLPNGSKLYCPNDDEIFIISRWSWDKIFHEQKFSLLFYKYWLRSSRNQRKLSEAELQKFWLNICNRARQKNLDCFICFKVTKDFFVGRFPPRKLLFLNGTNTKKLYEQFKLHHVYVP